MLLPAMPHPDQPEFFAPPGNSFLSGDSKATRQNRPLAVRMRPRTLTEILGQDHIVGEDCLLPRLISSDTFGSILLFGPPGSGKTSLAEVIALETKSRFMRLNAVLSNVAELRDLLKFARQRPEEKPILFIDEIHRFNKAQQDLLLPDVEEGNIRLIGATTHNPGHYVISPLVSRSHLFRLNPVPEKAVVQVLREALQDNGRGLGQHEITASDKILLSLARLSDGDLRRALNALETLALSLIKGSEITYEALSAYASERQIRYDADEDEHYDTISAFIKSVRGSDPDAALYWLAKMLAGGEDPRFIARRLVILASEDVGLADSRGLTLAVSAAQAVEFVGMPEAELNLAHATLFLALSPKSNSSTLAISAARKAIKDLPVQPVPIDLRDTGGSASKRMGHGKGYRYSHDYPENISGQVYMEQLATFYVPKFIGAETALAERLERWKQLRENLRKNVSGT